MEWGDVSVAYACYVPQDVTASTGVHSRFPVFAAHPLRLSQKTCAAKSALCSYFITGHAKTGRATWFLCNGAAATGRAGGAIKRKHHDADSALQADVRNYEDIQL